MRWAPLTISPESQGQKQAFLTHGSVTTKHDKTGMVPPSCNFHTWKTLRNPKKASPFRDYFNLHCQTTHLNHLMSICSPFWELPMCESTKCELKGPFSSRMAFLGFQDLGSPEDGVLLHLQVKGQHCRRLKYVEVMSISNHPMPTKIIGFTLLNMARQDKTFILSLSTQVLPFLPLQRPRHRKWYIQMLASTQHFWERRMSSELRVAILPRNEPGTIFDSI